MFVPFVLVTKEEVTLNPEERKVVELLKVTSMPIVMEVAKAENMSPLLLGMIWTFAAGGKLFAYQSGVLIVGYSYGYFEARDLVRIGWWLTVVEFLVLLVLVQVYWPLIGVQ